MRMLVTAMVATAAFAVVEAAEVKKVYPFVLEPDGEGVVVSS